MENEQFKYMNLGRGEEVPKDGTYICNVCMEGGMIDLMLIRTLREIEASQGILVPYEIRERRRLFIDGLVSVGKDLDKDLFRAFTDEWLDEEKHPFEETLVEAYKVLRAQGLRGPHAPVA